MRFSFLFIFLFSALSFSTYSQKSALGNWFIYIGNQKVKSNLLVHSEIQYRNYNFIGDLNQLLVRTGLGYNLTENNNTILAGYGFIKSNVQQADSDLVVSVNEHRIFQQFITKQNVGRVHLQHRYRVEERFIAKAFKVRMRYFLGIHVPINKSTFSDNTFYAAMYNEVFVHASPETFDRNRVYAALGYGLTKDLRFELGFMTQLFNQSNANQIQISFFNNVRFRK